VGKSENIKQSLKLTREKRKSQICKVYEVKVDKSHLNKTQKELLKMFFLESKWMYNHILNQEQLFKYNTKEKVIQRMNKEGEIFDYKMNFVPSQIKQGIHDRMKSNIKTLSSLKKKGFKVGKLKYRKEVNSLPLKQYGVTYKITSKNRIKIAGIKKPVLVRGLNQIPENTEFANAVLCKRQDDYYFQITTYQPIEQESEKVIETIGLDFGIKDNIITSDGRKFNIYEPETPKLKKLQRKMSKHIKGSNNKNKTRKKLQKEYSHVKNRRKDQANKVLHELKNNFVIIQEENLKGWHKGWFGKQVQNSAMGRIKSELKKSETTIVVDRWFPSTKLCPVCGYKEELTLCDRDYHCSNCGFYYPDRDIKAAKTILIAGLSIGTERINDMPVESRTAVIWESECKTQFLLSDSKFSVLKQEAQVFRLG